MVDVYINPTEIVIPPKVMTRFVLGYAVAKAKERLGKGDRKAGVGLSAISPHSSRTAMPTDRPAFQHRDPRQGWNLDAAANRFCDPAV